MQSFSHRTDQRPRSSDVSNDVESQPLAGKRIRGRNKPHKPRNGQIAIIPEGDNHFRYANYSIDDKMKKGPILGVLLKKHYPPIIEGTTRDGRPFKYHASKWEHYSHIVRDDAQTPADHVKQGFWSIYSVPEELEDDADHVFEKYARTQCKNMMYPARPDAVKHYYRETIKSPKSDAFACAKLLTFEEYMQCNPEWFTDEAWESLCKYLCSAEYLKKQRLGQESRKKNPDGIQNRGGSRPLVETQQYLEAKYGPGKGTVINAFSCMKAGLKNCHENGNAGPIPERAKKFVDDYNEALQEKYLENWQEQPFDGQIAYNIGGGLPHGRLAIGDGSVNKATLIKVVKASGTRPTTSRAFQNLLARYEDSLANVGRLTQQNIDLAQQNAALARDVRRNGRVLELILNKVQIEIPPDLLQEEEENDMGATRDGSSRASANMHGDNSDGH